MKIRPETPADYPAIRDILLAAFADHPYSRQTEHLIVEALRAAGAMTIGLVAEVDGRVVGQIAFSPAQIDGKDCPWYVLGPIAVEPGKQRQGIGQAMLRAGLDELRRLGAHGCALVGDPAYYHRFGFRNVPELTMDGVPAENFMALQLNDQIPIPNGELTHHPAFMTGL